MASRRPSQRPVVRGPQPPPEQATGRPGGGVAGKRSHGSCDHCLIDSSCVCLSHDIQRSLVLASSRCSRSFSPVAGFPPAPLTVPGPRSRSQPVQAGATPPGGRSTAPLGAAWHPSHPARRRRTRPGRSTFTRRRRCARTLRWRRTRSGTPRLSSTAPAARAIVIVINLAPAPRAEGRTPPQPDAQGSGRTCCIRHRTWEQRKLCRPRATQLVSVG
jgi:hypothetical protein